MYYKILENNGVEIENIDGAEFNYFASQGKSGIVKGILNECQINATGNQISVNTGLLILSGIRVKITELKSFSITGIPAVDTNYDLIAKVTLNTEKTVAFEMNIRSPQSLTTDNLFTSESGVYELKLAEFVYKTNGTISIIKKVDFIEIGGSGGSSVEIAQSTGQATDKVMSQKSVTDELAKKLDKTGGTVNGAIKLEKGVGQIRGKFSDGSDYNIAQTTEHEGNKIVVVGNQASNLVLNAKEKLVANISGLGEKQIALTEDVDEKLEEKLDKTGGTVVGNIVLGSNALVQGTGIDGKNKNLIFLDKSNDKNTVVVGNVDNSILVRVKEGERLRVYAQNSTGNRSVAYVDEVNAVGERVTALENNTSGSGGGTVKSINGKEPNENGDVELSADNVGAVEKITTSGNMRVYGVTANGSQTTFNIMSEASNVGEGKLPRYRSNTRQNELNDYSCVLPTGAPRFPWHATNKDYVDNHIQWVSNTAEILGDVADENILAFRLAITNSNSETTDFLVPMRSGQPCFAQSYYSSTLDGKFNTVWGHIGRNADNLFNVDIRAKAKEDNGVSVTILGVLIKKI